MPSASTTEGDLTLSRNTYTSANISEEELQLPRSRILPFLPKVNPETPQSKLDSAAMSTQTSEKNISHASLPEETVTPVPSATITTTSSEVATSTHTIEESALAVNATSSELVTAEDLNFLSKDLSSKVGHYGISSRNSIKMPKDQQTVTELLKEQEGMQLL